MSLPASVDRYWGGTIVGGGVILRHLSGAKASKLDPIEALRRSGDLKRLAFFNGLKLALDTIRGHKLRAFLTVLGVIIGTGTIIGVSAILTGFVTSISKCAPAASARIRLSSSVSGGPARRHLSPEERTRKDLTTKTPSISKDAARPGGRFAHDLPQQDRQRAFKGKRHVRRQPDGRGGSLRARRASGHSPRPLLRDEKAGAGCGGRGGADIEKGLYANMDPIAIPSWWTATSFCGRHMLRPAASFCNTIRSPFL